MNSGAGELARKEAADAKRATKLAKDEVEALKARNLQLEERADKFKDYASTLDKPGQTILKDIVNTPAGGKSRPRIKPDTEDQEPTSCKTQ